MSCRYGLEKCINIWLINTSYQVFYGYTQLSYNAYGLRPRKKAMSRAHNHRSRCGCCTELRWLWLTACVQRGQICCLRRCRFRVCVLQRGAAPMLQTPNSGVHTIRTCNKWICEISMCANLVKIILTPIMCYTLSGPNTFAVDPSRRTKLCWTRDPTRNAHQTIVRCIESMFHGGGSYNRRNRSGIDAL